MAFDTQITDLVGGTIDQTACDQWAADACKEIIHVLPDKLKAKCATRSTLNASATTLDLDSKGDILHATRLSADSGGFEKACREIPGMYGDLTNDSDDLNYYATATDPVYFITNNSSGNPTLFVRPNPTNAQPSYVHHITYPTVDVSAVSTIANFPDEAEALVVLYVAIKQLHQYMNSKRSDLSSDLVAPALELISESLPTWSAPDDFVVPVKPAVPSISAQSVSITGTAPSYVKPAFSAPSLGSVGNLTLPVKPAVPSISSQAILDPSSYAPTYTKPVLALKVAPTISNLSISATVPSVPALLVQTIADFSSVAPSYVSPIRKVQTAFDDYWSLADFGDNDPGTLSLTAVAPAVPSLSTTSVSFTQAAPTFTKPSIAPDFAQVNTYIDTNEDIELASAKLQEISAQLNEYSADIQNEQAEFNKESVEYQAQLQVSIQDAQFDNQEDARKLQKYQAEVSTYQANINKEVQEYGQQLSRYSTELNTVYTAWAKTESDNIQVFGTEIQNALNNFNKENAIYQATLQEKIQEAQLSDSNEAKKLQKYQAEVGAYSADVNKQVQEYQQNLQGDLQVWQTERQTDLQKYGSDIQNELNEFNKENAKYQAIIQEYTQEAQLLDAHEGRKLQKYQAEVSTYSAEVNAKVQEWVNEEWNQNFQKYQTDYSSKLQEYSTNIQNELNEFNKENTEYQAKLQKDIQDTQLSDAHEARKLQKYQAEVGTYSAELNTNVQVFTQALTKNRAAFDTSMQKYASEIQKVSASNASSLQKFQAETADYSAKLQKQGIDYQWYQSQYAQLKADYQQGLQLLIGGGAPAPPQQKQGR